MRFYLAASFARGAELLDYATILRSLGHEVNSSWIEISQNPALFQPEQIAAMIDISEIQDCDCLVSFLTTHDFVYQSGGRHVEFGYAYALEKKLVIIGPRENIFHYLPGVLQFDNFLLFIAWVKRHAPTVTHDSIFDDSYTVHSILPSFVAE